MKKTIICTGLMCFFILCWLQVSYTQTAPESGVSHTANQLGDLEAKVHDLETLRNMNDLQANRHFESENDIIYFEVFKQLTEQDFGSAYKIRALTLAYIICQRKYWEVNKNDILKQWFGFSIMQKSEKKVNENLKFTVKILRRYNLELEFLEDLRKTIKNRQDPRVNSLLLQEINELKKTYLHDILGNRRFEAEKIRVELLEKEVFASEALRLAGEYFAAAEYSYALYFHKIYLKSFAVQSDLMLSIRNVINEYQTVKQYQIASSIYELVVQISEDKCDSDFYYDYTACLEKTDREKAILAYKRIYEECSEKKMRESALFKLGELNYMQLRENLFRGVKKDEEQNLIHGHTAIDCLRLFCKNYPKSKQLDAALYYLVWINYFALDHKREAINYKQQLDNRCPKSDFKELSDLLIDRKEVVKMQIWFDPIYGGIPGAFIGFLGAITGLLRFVYREKVKSIIFAILIFSIIISTTFLITGIIAYLSEQPQGIWHGFGWAGLIGMFLFGYFYWKKSKIF